MLPTHAPSISKDCEAEARNVAEAEPKGGVGGQAVSLSRKERAKAFTDIVQEIVDDPDFEDNLEKMCAESGIFEITEEDMRRRFTI